MKTIIATAFSALLANGAHAFDASFDADEYHSGFDAVSSGVVLSVTQVEDLERDGKWQQFEDIPSEQPEVSDSDFPAHLYEEGNYVI